jgi:membrane-bound serine protease (ClpP class)
MFTFFQGPVLAQYLTVIGLVMGLVVLAVGVEIGIDLLLIGSILLVSGLIGVSVQNSLVAVVLSIILSIIYMLYGRTIIRRRLTVATRSTNIDRLIGKVATLKTAVDPESVGSIRIDDEDWRVRSSEAIAKGEKVTVVAVEGVTLEVTKA